MDRIFNDAKDKNVAAVVVYKKTSDVYAYADATKTKKISCDELYDMFVKGVVVVDGTNTYAPTAVKVTEGVATITYVTTDSSTATTAVLATLVSKEYTADGE